MPVLKKISNGRDVNKYIFYCVACKEMHLIDATDRTYFAGECFGISGGPNTPTVSPSIWQRVEKNGEPVDICHIYIKSGSLHYVLHHTDSEVINGSLQAKPKHKPWAGQFVPMVDVDEILKPKKKH